MIQHVYRRQYMAVLEARGADMWQRSWADQRLCSQLLSHGLYARWSDGLCIAVARSLSGRMSNSYGRGVSA